MRILVSEYVCSGAWPDDEAPPSLVQEGTSMLQAIVTDLARLPGVQVVSTWDLRMGPLPRFPSEVHVELASSTPELRRHLDTWIPLVDRALVIAPETQGVLERYCAFLREQHVPLINCSQETIVLTGDKYQTFLKFKEAGIHSIETQLATEFLEHPKFKFPIIAKLRDGVGSILMTLIHSNAQWVEFCLTQNLSNFIIQPFIRGSALSVATIFNEGKLQHIFPPCQQNFHCNAQFSYLGGRIPAITSAGDQILKVVKQVEQQIPGLHGYVGLDFLISHDDPPAAILVEINPRLTTSYIGYRCLSEQNLSRWLLQPETVDKPTFQGVVDFQANGDTHSCGSPEKKCVQQI